MNLGRISTGHVNELTQIQHWLHFIILMFSILKWTKNIDNDEVLSKLRKNSEHIHLLNKPLKLTDIQAKLFYYN